MAASGKAERRWTEPAVVAERKNQAISTQKKRQRHKDLHSNSLLLFRMLRMSLPEIQNYKKFVDLESAAYFLYPHDVRRPRARSNLRPFERTYGREWEWGTPGALPKWRQASRVLRLPCMTTVFFPVGDNRASWSNVMTSPPAFAILSRARSVTRRAQMRNLGTCSKRKSSVTVPTMTATLLSVALRCLSRRITRCSEITGRWILLMNRRFKMILLNFWCVRRYK